jgi:plastocyanin
MSDRVLPGNPRRENPSRYFESYKGVLMRQAIISAVALAAAGTALGIAGTASGRTVVTPLRATVGPGFTINLMKNGRRVVRLAPGMYRITVSDRSSIHNFKLEKSRGGAFERTVTSVPFTGTRTITVRLTPGRWEYYCVPHESTMEGHFTVGTGG